MTASAAPPPRQLPLSRLGHLIPPLVQGQALVALVPTTADLEWAAKAAWDIARIAAREGRRVALIDLGIEEPTLHHTVGLSPTDGIVDAFEYGVSLTKAAQQVDGVFFIAAGSYTTTPAEVFAHARWRKLQAGFRSEGALLLLFLSPAALAKLAAVADGAIVLAPAGLESASAAAADLAVVQERGTPLLGVARDRWTPPTHVAPPVAAVPTAPAAPRPSRGVRIAALTLVLAAGAGAWVLFAGPLPLPSAPPRRSAPPVAPGQAPPADTLAWTVQLAAYGSLETALAHADRLARDGAVPTLVTPLQRGTSGPVWYRVLAGSYPTREGAAAARDRLWRDGAAPRGIGDLLRAPYSLTLPDDAPIDSLRRRGLPATRWPLTGAVLVGAFETPDQAAAVAAALADAGARATLLPRLGTLP